MSVRIIDWPEEIAWISQYLEAYESQQFKVTQMEAGEIRRPLGMPRTQYRATVELDEREYSILRDIARSIVRVRRPVSDDLEAVRFAVSEDGRQTPLKLQESFVMGGPKTYTVRIDLAKVPENLLQVLSG